MPRHAPVRRRQLGDCVVRLTPTHFHANAYRDFYPDSNALGYANCNTHRDTNRNPSP